MRPLEEPHGGHKRGAEARGVHGGDNTGGLRSARGRPLPWVGGGEVSGPALESYDLGKGRTMQTGHGGSTEAGEVPPPRRTQILPPWAAPQQGPGWAASFGGAGMHLRPPSLLWGLCPFSGLLSPCHHAWLEDLLCATG